VSQVVGKVASIDNPNNFILLPSKDNDICSVSHLKDYMSIAGETNIDLRTGYLFRAMDGKSKSIVNKAVTSTSMTDRLRKHLTAINLYEGETSNSSRRGCSITLRMLGVADKEISNHIGWHSKNMINHYANIGSILSPAGAASTLSNATENLDKGTSKLNQVSNCFSNVNNLQILLLRSFLLTWWGLILSIG
jgi:hypothetical protein